MKWENMITQNTAYIMAFFVQSSVVQILTSILVVKTTKKDSLNMRNKPILGGGGEGVAHPLGWVFYSCALYGSGQHFKTCAAKIYFFMPSKKKQKSKTKPFPILSRHCEPRPSASEGEGVAISS